MEFIAVLPLLLLVSLCIWQGISLLQQRSEAASDARALARAAAICTKPQPRLADFDKGAAAAGSSASVRRALWFVTAEVRLVPQPIIGDLNVARAGIGPIVATATFRQEPCT